MGEEDELADLLRGIESNDADASNKSDSDDSVVDVVVVESFSIESEPTEEYTMSSDDDSDAIGGAGSGITQAEVYDNLKRIGELEDEKQAIQEELRARTEKLRLMLKHIDRGSILYKMLVSALPAPAPHASSSRATKKMPQKAVAIKAVKKSANESPKAKTAKKKAPKKKARRKS